MKAILFTGASGFLGANILPRLRDEYDKVVTLGHMPTDDITIDLSENIPELPHRFDIVLHAAGKAHVIPKTPEEEQLFFDINLRGTKNLCSALERYGIPSNFIFISTVAVYGCDEGESITEDHPLNGRTPYAVSKRKAEEYLISWCKNHNVILTILRPSLLAGFNPPGNLGDMINGIKKGFYVNIGGGKVRKSILMADDIANLIPLVEDKGGIYNVCDTDQPSFGEISNVIAKQLGKRKPISLPMWVAVAMAKVGDLMGNRAPINTLRLTKLTKNLTFSNFKARQELGWEPLKVLEHFHITQ